MKEEKQSLNEEKKKDSQVSRRDFLVGAGTVVVGGAIGAGLLSSCNSDGQTVTKTVETTKTVEKTTTIGGAEAVTVTQTQTVGAGQTVTATKTITQTAEGIAVPAYMEPEETMYTCGQARMRAVDVKNGKIVRMRPVKFDKDYPDFQPLSLTRRGKTYTAPNQSSFDPMEMCFRKRVDSPTRILYPLKRVDWEPGGDPAKTNTQNRGISKYKRISWEEAFTTIYSEMERVTGKYSGTEAVGIWSAGSHGEGKNVHSRYTTLTRNLVHWGMMKKYGTTFTDLHIPIGSWQGTLWGAYHVWGYPPYGMPMGNYFPDIAEYSDMVLCFGCNPVGLAWFIASQTFTGWMYMLKEIGIKQIYIQPDQNPGSGVLADKWIPIKAQTDCALMAAIAYIWITENTYDQDYIETHSVGFDLWKAYILGESEDMIPKTPQWASPLCGVPTWTIKALARQWANKSTSLIHQFHGLGFTRGPYGHESTRMEAYLCAMQSLGAPGKTFATAWGIMPSPEKPINVARGNGGAAIARAMAADMGIAAPANTDRDRQFMTQLYLNKEILDPENSPPYYYEFDQFYKREYPLEGKPEVHMIWQNGSTHSHGQTGAFELFTEGFRSPKIETFIVTHSFMEEEFRYADIILPEAIVYELDELMTKGPDHWVLVTNKQLIKPRGESKSGLWIALEMAKKFDLYDQITGGKDFQGFVDDLKKQGYENSGWQDLVSWEKLNEVGYFPQPPRPDWDKVTPPLRLFYEDPATNPLSTPTGLLEFESQKLKELFPDDKERKPVARYVIGGPKEQGWTQNESINGPKAERLPLVLLSNVATYHNKSMGQGIPWTREITRQICWDGYSYANARISPRDAADRGIASGDIIRVYNDNGSVLYAAVVTEMVMPGAVITEQAQGLDLISDALNRGGSNNFIAPTGPLTPNACSQVLTNYLVEVEKVTGDQMDEWRKNYSEAFERDYDPAYGTLFTAFVEGGN